MSITPTHFTNLSSHLSLGLRTLAPIALISVSPRLSGSCRPPTNLSQVHPRCLSDGIMVKAGGEGKGLGVFDLRFAIYDWGVGRTGRPE